MKILNIFGLIIFSFGVLVLTGFGFYEFLKEFLYDQDISFLVKFGNISIILGVFFILVSLIIERIKDNKNGK
ncbi:MAG: hypothetical protein U9Q27_02355 [Patescibacteria group bacterium]|nr:hypothetical protein [Patescibacteria group bacterium]